MINRATLFKAGWNAYSLARQCVFASGDETGKRRFLPDLFAKMLRRAWAEAKTTAARAIETATARAFIAAQSRAMADKAAALSPGERSLRISQLRDELTLLDYAPLGVRTASRRRELAAELSAFAA